MDLAGGSAVLVPGPVGDASPDLAALESARTPRTGAVVVNNSWGMNEFSAESFYDGHCKLSTSVCAFATGDAGYPCDPRQGHIPGSVHTAHHDIHELPWEVDGERPVAAICASGQRAAIAASLLKRFGVREVIHVVDGGVPRWEREGWPIER